jgi:hypothetical protein
MIHCTGPWNSRSRLRRKWLICLTAFLGALEQKQEEPVDKAVACCQDPDSLVDVELPFSKIVALGFYDGPTSGLLQCGTCSAAYKFDLLDWDESHEVRIFRLASLPADSVDQIVKILAPAGSPRWPVWVPSRWNFPSEDARQEADRDVQPILQLAKAAELIIAWTGYGERVLAARRLPPAELADLPDWFSRDDSNRGRDWFRFLGLAGTNRVARP